MTFPAVILGFVISSLIGALFHIWRGGGASRLLVYLIASWAGFWIGHLIGDLLSFTFLKLGPINLGMALVGCIALLALGHWLSLVENTIEKK